MNIIVDIKHLLWVSFVKSEDGEDSESPASFSLQIPSHNLSFRHRKSSELAGEEGD